MKLQTSGVLGTSYAIAKLAPKREDLDSKIENPKIKYIILTRGYEKGKEY